MKNITSLLLDSEKQVFFELDIEKDNFNIFKSNSVSPIDNNYSKIIKTHIRENISNDIKPTILNIGDNILKVSYFPQNDNIISGVFKDITEVYNNANSTTSLINARDIFLEINHEILSSTNEDDLYAFILNKVMELFDFPDCGTILKLDDNGYFYVLTSVGYTDEITSSFKLHYKDTYQWELLSTNNFEPVIFNDLPKLIKKLNMNCFDNNENFIIQSTISAPIIINNKLFGMISIDSTKNNFFNDFHTFTMAYIKEQLNMAFSKHLMFNKIKTLSNTDSLTKLYNRNYFKESMELAITNKTPFTLAFIDINVLKKINDRLGHSFGDFVLKDFSKNLSNISQDELHGRLGGDEFAIAFFNKSKIEVSALMDDLLNSVQTNDLYYNKTKLSYSFSYGLSQFPENGTSYDNLIKFADSEMYEQKKAT